jgi:hypothetical protein
MDFDLSEKHSAHELHKEATSYQDKSASTFGVEALTGLWKE